MKITLSFVLKISVSIWICDFYYGQHYKINILNFIWVALNAICRYNLNQVTESR